MLVKKRPHGRHGVIKQITSVESARYRSPRAAPENASARSGTPALRGAAARSRQIVLFDRLAGTARGRQA
jgi:hypothetical protein